MKTLTYNEFLFLRLAEEILTLEINGFKDLEYDLQFSSIKDWYSNFLGSSFNDVNYPEYECIVDYLKNKPELTF